MHHLAAAVPPASVCLRRRPPGSGIFLNYHARDGKRIPFAEKHREMEPHRNALRVRVIDDLEVLCAGERILGSKVEAPFAVVKSRPLHRGYLRRERQRRHAAAGGDVPLAHKRNEHPFLRLAPHLHAGLFHSVLRPVANAPPIDVRYVEGGLAVDDRQRIGLDLKPKDDCALLAIDDAATPGTILLRERNVDRKPALRRHDIRRAVLFYRQVPLNRTRGSCRSADS